MYKRLSGAFVKTDRGMFCCWPRYIVALCMHRIFEVGMVTTNIKRNRICVSCSSRIIFATFQAIEGIYSHNFQDAKHIVLIGCSYMKS